MSLIEVLAIFVAGVGAGTINTIVGTGTLITFPTLLFFGHPPLLANMSNNIGLMPGSLSGTYGYRRELKGQGATLRRLLPMSLLGGAAGAGLLLFLPPGVFAAVVPLLIGLGLLLVIFGPALQRRAAAAHHSEVSPARRALLPLAAFFTGVYGGYFGAAQGVILMGIMSVLMAHDLQVLNAIKNFLVFFVNGIAAVIFVSLRGAEISWVVAGLIGAGSLLGGVIGARVGRRLSPVLLRTVIIVVGVVAIVRLTVWR